LFEDTRTNIPHVDNNNRKLSSENLIPSNSALLYVNKNTNSIEDKIKSLKNIESSFTIYKLLNPTPLVGKKRVKMNDNKIILIPNLLVFLKLFSLKKKISSNIKIKVEQKIKISGIAKYILSIPKFKDIFSKIVFGIITKNPFT
tara:strand:+ start:696 stop:1127 length:432 start_codon:yes stop_codon:yes gene_type:complete